MENWGNSNLSTPVTASSPPCQKNTMSSVVYPSVSRSGQIQGRRGGERKIKHVSVMKNQPLKLTAFLFKVCYGSVSNEWRSLGQIKLNLWTSCRIKVICFCKSYFLCTQRAKWWFIIYQYCFNWPQFFLIMSFYQTVDMLNCIAKHTFNHLHDVFSIKVTFF